LFIASGAFSDVQNRQILFQNYRGVLPIRVELTGMQPMICQEFYGAKMLSYLNNMLPDETEVLMWTSYRREGIERIANAAWTVNDALKTLCSVVYIP